MNSDKYLPQKYRNSRRRRKRIRIRHVLLIILLVIIIVIAGFFLYHRLANGSGGYHPLASSRPTAASQGSFVTSSPTDAATSPKTT